jgi:hypothetical protein
VESPSHERSLPSEAAIPRLAARRSPVEREGDALAVLLVSEDVHAFARAIGLTEGATTALLEAIRDRAAALLAAGGEPSGGRE